MRNQETQAVRDLLESDAEYFGAGARIEPVPGAEIVFMPGLESLAAGCVVQRSDPERLGGAPDTWLAGLETRLRSLGARRARIYLQGPARSLERAMESRGYRAVGETGLLAPARFGTGKTEGLGLEPIVDRGGWDLRLALYQALAQGPDGFRSDPADWVYLERCKVEAGYMRPFLVTLDGRLCGAVNLAPCGSVARLKNLAVHPEFRGKGVGTGTAARFPALAAGLGLPWTGSFAIDGSGAEDLYRRAGFRPVTHQRGWTKVLEENS